MGDDKKSDQDWVYSERPPNLFRRFQFNSYRETRDFLDRLATLSKEVGYYPNISFGKTYANVTVQARDDSTIGAEDQAFAKQVDKLAESAGPP